MTDLDAAADFIWLHARLIDRRRFAHLFLGAPPEPVVDAVRGYRNADGGFGHALEPDLRTPTSQPAHVQHALDMLGEAGAIDHPMVDGACDFLLSVARPDGGVPFALPTALDHPRAPWWQAEDASSLIQTAANAAVLHRHGRNHPWLKAADRFCWERIEALQVSGAYEGLFAVAFLDAAPDRPGSDAALDALGAKLLDEGVVTVDPNASGDVHTPLDFSPWPDARSRRLFDAGLIDAHLDALVRGQQEDGGWTFGWPAWAPAAAHEWRGWLTVRALTVLRANGRLTPATS